MYEHPFSKKSKPRFSRDRAKSAKDKNLLETTSESSNIEESEEHEDEVSPELRKYKRRKEYEMKQRIMLKARRERLARRRKELYERIEREENEAAV